jgi:hypothetical protein
VFILGIFVCSQSGDHPQEDLAKSGYKSEIKYKSCIILLYIFGHTTQKPNIQMWQFSLSFSPFSPPSFMVTENFQKSLLLLF